MPQRSAGLLLYNRRDGTLSVLLVHPGGPFWRNKDAGAWQIPKGLVEPGEDAAAAALREASEVLGTDFRKREADAVLLGEIRQAGGKLVARRSNTLQTWRLVQPACRFTPFPALAPGSNWPTGDGARYRLRRQRVAHTPCAISKPAGDEPEIGQHY